MLRVVVLVDDPFVAVFENYLVRKGSTRKTSENAFKREFFLKYLINFLSTYSRLASHYL